MQGYYQNEPRFNWVYSRDNLSKNIKDEAYVINLHERIGLLYVFQIMMLFNLIVLELNMFLKRLKYLLQIKNENKHI